MKHLMLAINETSVHYPDVLPHQRIMLTNVLLNDHDRTTQITLQNQRLDLFSTNSWLVCEGLGMGSRNLVA
jgi:hypothetical protein